MRIVIGGLFKFYEGMIKLAEELERELKVECVLPKHFKGYKSSREIEEMKEMVRIGSIKLTEKDLRRIGEVENWFFNQIENSNCLVVYNKNGYVGINTSCDIGYALAHKKPVILLYKPKDMGIRGLEKAGLVKIVEVGKIKEYLKDLRVSMEER